MLQLQEFLYTLINWLLTILYIAVIGRALFSWFDPQFRNPIGRLLFDITEPILRPIRSILPRTGMIDISPIVAIFLIYILQTLLNNILF
ncbi:MAG: YggT family protein [Chloroflexi bacterium]|nr:YggT family protein [Chloroflexota bacterium]